jgi:hypothetical protein
MRALVPEKKKRINKIREIFLEYAFSFSRISQMQLKALVYLVETFSSTPVAI